MRTLGKLLTAVAMAISAPASAQDAGETQARQQTDIERGRAVSRLLLAGETDALSARMSPAFLAAVGGSAGIDRLMTNLRDTAGTEVAVEEEAVFREAGFTHYYRRSRFEKFPDATVYWIIDDTGTIHGGSVRPTQPSAPTVHLDYSTKAALRLPFAAASEGRWYVGWGGRDVIHNYHAAARDQRFAYDFYVTADGRPFRTDGKAVQDYYCFGQPILAPAAGSVTAAVDGLPDNAPGVMDRANPVGNHIVIDHGGEFSFLAHLQQGSVSVRPGDRVSAGQPIGLCGNSGNTSMPHLHYHLQTTAIFAQGEGLPAQFSNYRADGVQVERGEPRRGEQLEP